MKTQFACLRFSLLVVLLSYNISLVLGQSKPIPLRHIVFKDKVLEGNLNAYINKVRNKVISVDVERRDKAFLYKLSGISFYESIKNYPPRFWGQWRNHVLVFWAGPELKDICTITDTTAFANLLNYVRPLLPDKDSPEIRSKNYKPDPSIPNEGLEGTFKVENGKEVWLWSNDGYDSRDIPEVPYPN